MTPATNRQVPDNAILNHFDKQIYLGNQFSYALDPEIATTSEFPLILLTCPQPASGFPSLGASNQWQSIFQGLRRLQCLTASQNAILRIYAGPTVTSVGTPQTPNNLRISAAQHSIAALSTNPTISANGVLMSLMASNAFVTDEARELIVVDPNQSLLVTVQTSSATTFVGVELNWYEL